VTVHLDACLDCAAAYARVYELELAAATKSLPQPTRYAAPDLSFLPLADTPPNPQGAGALQNAGERARAIAEQLRTALRRTGDLLTLQLSADLLALLRPLPTAAALRAPADAERYGEVLFALDPEEVAQAPVGMVAYRDARRPEECLVEVSVVPPGRAWPDLGGTLVTLVTGGDQRTNTTDPWGMASFEGFPIARLVNLALEVHL
jgi:hypothetical protein